MSIFDVRHQPRAHRIIQRARVCDRLPHAYLFHGPDGVGKEMMAIRLAHLLLCAAPEHVAEPPLAELSDCSGALVDACGRCRDCVLAGAETHPDLHLIHRELHRHHPDPRIRKQQGRDMSVEVVRQFIIHAAGAKPVRGRAKVFLIREADRITHQAQNALLKTLEEPPRATFLILLSSSLDALLPTTKSRCQIVPFGPLPTAFVAARLTELRAELPAEDASSYAALAGGSLGRALRLADEGLLAFNERTIAALQTLGKASAVGAAKGWVTDAKELGAQYRDRDKGLSETEALRRGLKTLFALAGMWFGDRLRASIGDGTELVNSRHAGALAASPIDPHRAADAIRAIVDAERQLDQNAATQLTVEALMIRLSRIAPATTDRR